MIYLKSFLFSLLVFFYAFPNLSAQGFSKTPNLPEKISSKVSSKVEYDRLVNSLPLSCANDVCSSSVGMLVSILNPPNQLSKVNLSLCTGFLVAEDMVMTNAHCIDRSFLSNGFVPFQFQIVFPSSSFGPRQSFAIESIVRISSEEELNAGIDYAFLRLSQKTSRPWFHLSRKGLLDESVVHVYKFNPNKNSLNQPTAGGVIEHTTCTVRSNVFNYSGIGPFSGSIALSGCEIEHGNSGSPVVDLNGKVRGIIHSYYQVSDSLKKSFFDYDLIEKDFSFDQNISRVTNLSCIETPFDHPGSVGFLKSSVCKKINGSSENISLYEKSGSLGDLSWRSYNYVQGEIKRNEFSLMNYIDVGISSSGENYVFYVPNKSPASESVFFPFIRCFKRETIERLSEKFSLNLPMWRVKVFLTPYKQLHYRIKEIGFSIAKIEYSQADLLRNKKTMVYFSIKNLESNLILNIQEEIGFCPQL